MTPFCVEHVFAGVAPETLLRSFTDPDHQAAQDRAADVERREIVSVTDDAASYRCESWVYPRRKLPAALRAFVKGGLECHEIVTWDKATDALAVDVHPAVMGGVSRVAITCRVVADPAGSRRIYAGTVTVDVRFVGARIEKKIVAEITAALDVAHAATLAWLAERAP